QVACGQADAHSSMLPINEAEADHGPSKAKIEMLAIDHTVGFPTSVTRGEFSDVIVAGDASKLVCVSVAQDVQTVAPRARLHQRQGVGAFPHLNVRLTPQGTLPAGYLVRPLLIVGQSKAI